MLKRLHNKNFINTLAIASIAGLAFSSTSVCAQNLNPADYVENSYGTGDSTKYYKYEINSQGNHIINPVEEGEEYDFGVNYDTANPKERVENTTDNSSVVLEGSFIDLEDTYNPVLHNNQGKLGGIKGIFANNYKNRSQVNGGIIHNAKGDIGEIEGTFIGNHTGKPGAGMYRTIGNVIYNTGTTGHIGSIKGKFIGNYMYTGGYTYGGAIYSDGGAIIDDIDADFIGNYIYGNNARSNYGGAIGNFSGATIKNLKGNFIGNYITYGSFYNRGGAIDNRGTIENLEADFIGNHIEKSTDTYNQGGAIYNQSAINHLKGNFEGNYIDAYDANGGAIYNDTNGVIGVKDEEGNLSDGIIDSSFNGNYAKATSSSAYGGAIYNLGTINLSNTDFSNNYTISPNNNAYGGAIYNNNGTLPDITGNFNGNYTQSGANASGGAIYNNNSTIQEINGDFTNNHVESKGTSTNAWVQGGAISNYSGTISKIEGSFRENYAKSMNGTGDGIAKGGAIMNRNSGKITEINGEFTGNYAISGTGEALSGAIHLQNPDTNIETIKGTFTENYAQSDSARAGGGAISLMTTASLNKIDSVGFEGNYAQSNSGSAQGGAIHNEANINEIQNTNFTNNYAKSETGEAHGGAIYTTGEIEELNAKFLANHVISNESNAKGGAMSIDGETSVVKSVSSEFDGNYAEGKTAAQGGALYNNGTITEGVTNSSFTNNYAKSPEGTAQGGAIYTEKDLQLNAKDGYEFKISGNYVEDKNGIRPEGIYIHTSSSGEAYVDTQHIGEVQETGQYIYQEKVINGETFEPIKLTLDATNKGTFIIDDQIVGTKPETKELTYHKYPIMDRYDEASGEWIMDVYLDKDGNPTDNPEIITETISSPKSKLQIKGDNTGKVYINNELRHLDIEHDNVTTYVKDAQNLSPADATNSFTMNSGTMNIAKMAPVPLHFENFGMNGGTINIDSVDVDLANKKMGRITADNYTGNSKGTINVKAMNLLSDGKKAKTAVRFADKSFKNTVKTSVKEAYTPIYKYDVKYDTKKKTDDGYFVFTRPETKPIPAPTPSMNPAVLASPVATQMGANAAMNEALRFAFEHGDTFMNFSSMDRFAQINQNTYAMADTTPLLKNRRGEGVRYDKLALSTDYNDNAGYVDFSHENKSVWVKPYSVFESINLKNGPKVDTISYGSLVGFDSNIHRLKKGWYNVGTGYIGYNGAQIDYKGVDASMNGGLFGLTETFYKGNFWTALTATVGAAGVEAHTMYGKDDMAMLMTGIGSKTGYNFEFADGKFIIQPRIFVAYSMVNTFDYTNAAGVKIDSDPMHTIQINPAIKFIGNTRNGWQPYASVGMTWNLLNETETTANGVRLPEMHTKPYVEYGVGVQKLWNDKYSAYGQAMVRNGGRTSVALTLGFRSALGEDGKPIEKTQAKPQKSTMTNNIGYIK